MRRIARFLLLLFAFTIPWEYSLELGEPLGNISRIVGLVLLLAAILAVLEAGRLRKPGPIQWLVLALYLWICCSCLWTIDQELTLGEMRGYFQEMMVVWLVWEFAENPSHLRWLLRAWVAGSWVLAILTVLNLISPETVAAEQIRFAAGGTDPNDVARFLDLGFPMAALLIDGEPHWTGRLLASGYLPLGVVAVLLTASRGGFVAAMVSLAGCGILLARGHARGVLAGVLSLPVLAAGLWFTAPHATLERLATITEQVTGGDLNQRLNIWNAGWQAFAKAPFVGHGAGTFVVAAGLAPIDTAHNTPLTILVTGGLCAFFLATAIVALAAWAVLQTSGPLRVGFATALVVWLLTSMVATVEESRTTWLLIGLIALAGRLAAEEPEGLAACFPEKGDQWTPAGSAWGARKTEGNC